ncbi:hypothetical protein IEQ34_022676 [Dendrobium chrysotoxum]|uniref:RNase H type-1 domain-containing protein n=1 Tax=Dendrobium chrysotoxum TaxID=161865 RepID=A0AAV7FXS9_DENCH|nr:hypothetical protein IEQ34_022676 [Dendrobium chrysotoxum]
MYACNTVNFIILVSAPNVFYGEWCKMIILDDVSKTKKIQEMEYDDLERSYKGGVGGVARDCKGRLLFAFGFSSLHWDHSDLEYQSILSLKYVLQEWMFELKGIIIEGDNVNVMKHIQILTLFDRSTHQLILTLAYPFNSELLPHSYIICLLNINYVDPELEQAEGGPTPAPAPTPIHQSSKYKELLQRFDQWETHSDTYVVEKHQQHKMDMAWFGEQFTSIHR